MEDPNDASPDAKMGPLRKGILIIGLNIIFLLGIVAGQKFQSSLIVATFIVCTVVYFIWVAQWTRWK